MGKINIKQNLLFNLDSYCLNEFVEHSLKSIKGRTPEEKAMILKQFPAEVIMAGYHKGLLKNIFYLLPDEYKNDEELVFIACLYGDDISSRSEELKHNHEFNCYLAANTINATKYLDDKELYKNNKEALLILLHEHLDSFCYVPKKNMNSKLIEYYLSCNADKIKESPNEKVFYLLSNMTSQFKINKTLAMKASEINIALLYSFSDDVVAKYLADKDDLFYTYLGILYDRIHILGNDLKDFFKGECVYTKEKESITDKYYVTSEKIQKLLKARNDCLCDLDYAYIRRRKFNESNRNKK